MAAMTWSDIIGADLEDVTTESLFEELRDYLRAEPEDDGMVLRCAKSAYAYIKAAVGEVNEEDPTVTQLLYAITQDFYDNRELMQSEQQLKKRMQFMYQSIILQLQMKYAEANDELA